jgi:replicative DNA helicase
MIEEYILNSILEEPTLLDKLFMLEGKHFKLFKKEYETMLKIYSEDNTISLVSLDLHNINIPKLNDFIYTEHLALDYSKLLFDNYQRDFLLKKIKSLETKHYDELKEGLLDAIEITETSYEKNNLDDNLSDLVSPFFNEVQRLRDSDEPRGIELKTLPQMNEIIKGILPGDLIGIYGKEKSTKSTLGMEIMLDICIDQKIPGAIFSFEMLKDLLIMKAISMRTGINIYHLRNPHSSYLSQEKFDNYRSDMLDKVRDTNLFLIDTSMNEVEIERTVKKLARKGVKIILIDYLMLIRTSGRHNSRRDELNFLSAFFKYLAQKYSIAIVLISQANDSGEREAEAKGLSRDSNYYFYIAKLEIGDNVKEGGVTSYTCQNEDEFVVKNRGIRHGKLGKYFITKFENNIYKDKLNAGNELNFNKYPI